MEAGLLSVEGRITRGTFWARWLLALLINLMVGLLAGAAGAPDAASFLGFAMSVVVFIQGVKRMHDVDRSGWCMLIPVYNLILALSEGTPGENHYGTDPAGRR